MHAQERTLNSLAWLTVFCAVGIAPLLPFRLQPISAQLPNAWSAIGFSVFLLIYSLFLYVKKIRLQWNYAIWSWIVALLLIFIHTRFTLAGHKDALIFPAAAMLLAGCIHLATLNASEKLRNTLVCSLAWACYVAGAGTFLLQLHQLIDASFLKSWVFPLPLDMQPFGNVAQRNEAAFFHSLAMVGITHWLATRCRQWTDLMVAVGLMLPLIAGISLTGSRLFLVLGGVVFATCLTWLAHSVIQKTLPAQRIKSWLIAVWFSGVAIYALAYIFFIFAVNWIPHRPLFDSVVERISNVSNLTRVALQQQAWAMFIDKPFTGQGWGSFSAFGLQWSDRSILPLFADHSHFLPSQILAEMGLLGLMAFTPLFWLIIKTQFQPNLWKSYFLPQFMVLLTMIYSCSEFPLWNGYLLFPFAMSLGIVSANKSTSNYHAPASTPNISPDDNSAANSINSTNGISAIWIAFFAGFITLGAVVTSKVYIDLHFIGGSVFTGKKIAPDVFDKVNKIEPAFGFSAIKEVYLFVGIATDSNDLQNKIALGERLTKRFTDAPILLQLGILYAINDEEEKLIRIIQDACRFYPLKCDETIAKIEKLPNIHDNIFRNAHQYLTEWWLNNPRNPRSAIKQTESD